MRNGRGPGEAFAFDEREVNCFVDLFATRDRIYAPYDGELRVKEFLKPRWNGGRCNFTGSPCSTGTGMRWSGSRPTGTSGRCAWARTGRSTPHCTTTSRASSWAGSSFGGRRGPSEITFAAPSERCRIIRFRPAATNCGRAETYDGTVPDATPPPRRDVPSDTPSSPSFLSPVFLRGGCLTGSAPA